MKTTKICHFRKFFFQCWADRRINCCRLPRKLSLLIFIQTKSYNITGLFIKFFIPFFVRNILKYKQAACYANSKSENIEQRITSAPAEIADRDFEIIF